METIHQLNASQLCRLCGKCGNHKTDIIEFDPDIEENDARKLRAKIFRCVGIQVERNDRMTKKLCDICLTKIDIIIRFRELCASTDMQMRDLIAANDRAASTIAETLTEMSSEASKIENSDDENVPLTGRVSTTIRSRTAMESSTVDEEAYREDHRAAANHLNVDPSSERTNAGARASADTTYDEYVEMELSTMTCGAIKQNGNGQTTRPAETNDIEDTVVVVSSDDDEEPIPRLKVRDSKKRKKNIPARNKKKSNGKATVIVEDFKVKCITCRELFENNDALIYHKSTYHARGIKRIFHCYFCKKSMQKKQKLKNHVNAVHTGYIRFKCSIGTCSRIFAYKDSLKRHINAAHKGKPN